MGFWRRHRWSAASGAILAVGVVALVFLALSTQGYQVRHVDLNDGGIWVTSDQDGLFGRLNKPVGSLDAAMYPVAAGSTALDIRQDGAAVVAWDQTEGKLYPVDVTRSALAKDHGDSVGTSMTVQLAGGTLAILDPSSGNVWAQRVDPSTGIGDLGGLDTSGPPLVSVDPPSSSAGDGPSANLAVDHAGTIYAAGSSGKTVVVSASGVGFGSPHYGQLGRPLTNVQVSAVGSQLVVFDAVAGTLMLPSGKIVQVDADPQAMLQAPSSGPSVAIATSTALLAVDAGSGSVNVLAQGLQGAPAQPTWLSDCLYAAWAGDPGAYEHSCGGAPAEPGNVKDLGALVQPVFRKNRNFIVLNDLSLGKVIDLDTGQSVDNWQQVKPPPKQDQSDQKKDHQQTSQEPQPPKATDDVLGARPDRTTILHVLDNDSDPQGSILSITSVSESDNPAATLAVAPDGQSVQITLGSDLTSTHFKYTIDDGQGLSATANVTVEVHPTDQNGPPALRQNFAATTWNVGAGASLSLPVLSDWRDPDGDPVSLLSAAVGSGSATSTPDGRVQYTAGAVAGPQTITYNVTDGVSGSEPVPATISVNVLDPSSTSSTAAVAEPDVARGTVGQPITIHPLANDLPGSDPANPAAKLALAGRVSSPDASALTVDTDTSSGVVTVLATQPGTFTLTYSAAFGNAPFSEGKIRVDVAAVPPSPLPPVTMADNVVLFGQAPNTVDVVANDFDPAGQLLVVQHAEVAGDSNQLEVAIVQGRWVRVRALRPVLNPTTQLIRYTVTDGLASATTGEVTVTQLPPPETTTPTAVDDYATVRVGDSVEIPVLDNDISPGGDPLSLAPAPNLQTPGSLTVTSSNGSTGDENGKAYVAGQVVRYVPPPAIDVQQTMVVDYVAQNTAGEQVTGHIHVTVVPAPTDLNPDQPPTPVQVEARVVAGDSVSVTIPTSLVDPDGDSVSAQAIASAPTLGRVTAIGATSITYESFPTSAGTDTFRYLVTDSYGKTGESLVRVAVVPPGEPQPPVAVDDQVTAAPGSQLQIDVLANDLIAPDDNVTISPASEADAGFPDGVSLGSPTGPIEVTAPQVDGKPLVVVYAVSDGLGAPSVGTLTVRSQKDFNNPPLVTDAFAQPESNATTATVNALDGAYDPEGGALKVTKVFRADATVDGGSVTVPVSAFPETVAFEVSDDGNPAASSVAVIHVPPVGGGAPTIKAGQTITIDKNGTKTVDIGDYVSDPNGKSVRLTTTDQISAAPSTGLQVVNDGDTRLTLTGLADYVGPAAISFEVTDGQTLDDPEGITAFLTVPVQVGPVTPVLRCPSDPLTVLEGGDPLKVDVGSVCHVWLPNKADVAGLNYDASWNKSIDGVSLDGSGSHLLTVTASGSAQPGATGEIKVGVAGTEATPSALAIVVVPTPPPNVTPVVIDGFKDGDTATVDLTQYVTTRIRDPKISVVDISQQSGDQSNASFSGSTVQITPGASAVGVVTFSVTVTDVADSSRADRHAAGSITLNVLNRPDPPTNVTPDRTTLSHVVQLSWTTPANNGAPIDNYEVDYPGGSQNCAASPCSITGLTNGTAYAFTVKAHNLVGFSDPSAPSPSARPDAVPDAVTNLVTSNPADGALTLSWNPAHVDGTAIDRYEISWTGGGSLSVPGGQTSATATNLVNDNKYTFTVVAVNQLGPGPSAAVQGQSAGKPKAPGAPTFTATNDTSGNTRVVVLNWAPVDPNGIAPTSYSVTRSGTTLSCTSPTTTTCRDTGVALDGTVYQYSLSASNAAPGPGHTSDAGPTTPMEAAATPDPITGIATNVVVSTPDGKVPVTFTAGASHGKSSTVTCSYSGGSCGSTGAPTSGGSVSMTLTFPASWSGSFTLTDCNGSAEMAQAGSSCSAGTSASAASNGPPKAPVNGSCLGDNGSTATFGWQKPSDVGARTVVRYNLSNAGSGSTTSTQYSMGVAKDGKSHTLVVHSVDNNGEQSTGSISITCTDPSPPPPPSISASQGPSGSISTCPGADCHWLQFTLSSNFPSGRYSWQCITGGVVSYDSANYGNTYQFNAGATYSGSGSNGFCIWGAGVGSEQIRINGITSNAVPHS